MTLSIQHKNIKNLQKYFLYNGTSILEWHYIDCSFNNISELPEIPENVSTLYCNVNNLIKVPKFNEGLVYLDLECNQLTSIEGLPESLLFLNIAKNEITKIAKVPKKLSRFKISSNQIKRVPEMPQSITSFNVLFNKLPNMYPEIDSLEVHRNVEKVRKKVYIIKKRKIIFLNLFSMFMEVLFWNPDHGVFVKILKEKYG